MPRFRNGFQRSAREVGDGIRIVLLLAIIGIMIVAFSNAFATLHIPSIIDMNAIYSQLLVFMELVGIISTIAIILKMPYWGTLYMLGWIAGFIYFWYLGLVNLTDIAIYIVPSIVVLVLRLYNKINHEDHNGGY